MQNNLLKRKWLAIGIILLFVGTCIIPAIAQDNEKSVIHTSKASDQKTDRRISTAPRGFFGIQSIIIISWGNETQEPLVPGGEPRIININVTYNTVVGFPFGQIILRYCILTHQYVTVTLDIGDIPSWCTAYLSNTQLRFPITGTPSSQVSLLAVAVNEYAPAYEVCEVPLNASVNSVHGPFGFLTFIDESTQSCTLQFIPGYFPRIIVTPASDFINATPGDISVLPINITNTGNARTLVFIEILNPPENWIIFIPSQVALEVNMSCEINLSVHPPYDFNGTETITIAFTPHLADDISQYGEPVYITIAVICKP